MYASLKTHGNFRVLPGVCKEQLWLKSTSDLMFSKMYFSESTEISVSPFAFRSKILFSYFEIVVNAINIGLSQTCDWTVFRASNL